MSERDLAALAQSLRMSIDGLRALEPALVPVSDFGFVRAHKLHTKVCAFPMRNGGGQIVGIRLRSESGAKWCVPGSRQGLFLPAQWPTASESLVVAEGATDAAALLGLGLAAIGRPSCTGAIQDTITLLRRLEPRRVTVFNDADEPGRRGGWALARSLRAHIPEVLVAEPPPGLKDARAWIATGVSSHEVLRHIDVASTPVQIAVSTAHRSETHHGRH